MGTSRASTQTNDDGFTLIEVMVVVLIIGILLSIGVPTFLGARERAADRAAQSTLTTAHRAATVFILEDTGITRASDVVLNEAEPSIEFQSRGHPSRIVGTVSVWSHDSAWRAASLSASGTCFFLRQLESGEMEYGTIPSDEYCTGTLAESSEAEGW